jgi:glycyl-tRNA synthetase beta subunit
VRIVRDKPAYELHADKFEEEAEKELFEAYFKMGHRLHPEEHNVDRLMAVIMNLVPNITHFFDDVLVMDENQAVRENRLALLQHIANLAKGYADLSQLPGF